MERYLCIHGHFYQPPRENPCLETIELQDSAYPYHDWNERISAECYAPNTASRLLDQEGRILDIVNNYSKISFNFGPTLLNWLKNNDPETYRKIQEADRESQKRFSGHGSALAQPYNHMILPLANRRDKETQILWGIRDFEYHFARKPEGMWLPETAVDVETLEILADQGIRFTLLAPHQAGRIRQIGDKAWKQVPGGRIDPTSAYDCRLPSGKKIVLLFYDAPISRGVAFEGLLSNGEAFAQRLLNAFSQDPGRTWPQLVHIATDGETYGHHHRFGDMALAYALHFIESNKLAKITNYGEYLEKHPPTQEVEILERTSWSCAHGIERWRSNCGCNSGGHPGWNQAWRGPLRESLDWLRDSLLPLYEEEGKKIFPDPWTARHAYIQLLQERSPENLQRVLTAQAGRDLNDTETTQALKLLEIQRHAMLMYTSCGWFFDELSGIETVQVIQYAGRAIQLAQEVFGKDLEAPFLERLEKAQSNIPGHKNGRTIYEKFVRPARVNLPSAAAHYAISSLFEAYAPQTKIYCYSIDCQDYQTFKTGKAQLVIGKICIRSEITLESAVLTLGILHFGDHNLNGGIRAFRGEQSYRQMLKELEETFSTADFPETLRRLDAHFGSSTYSLRALFRDEQRKILNRILENTLQEVEAAFHQLYEHHAPLMRFIADLHIPLPKAFRTTTEFVLNMRLKRAFEAETPEPELIRSLLAQAQQEEMPLDTTGFSLSLERTLERMFEKFLQKPQELELIQSLNKVLELLRDLPFEINLWKIQNGFHTLFQSTYPEMQQKASQGEEGSRNWIETFQSLAQLLHLRIS